MDKAGAIKIIVKSAKLYKEQLENNKVLFVYGNPQEVKKYIDPAEKGHPFKCYEAIFLPRNFCHLTGVKTTKRIESSSHFYNKALDNNLSEKDFEFNPDGTTVQKLEVLEYLMKIKTLAIMFGNFTNNGPNLYTEKVSGTTTGCMGFVYSDNDKSNVPNTLLKKDIREIILKPNNKIFAIFYKDIKNDKYQNISKLDKTIDFNSIYFSEEIEKLIDRDNMALDFKICRENFAL